MNDVSEIRSIFQSLTKEEKEAHLRSLSKEEAHFYYKHPDIFLFDKQIILPGEWFYYLLRCGRGFGKSYTGAAHTSKWVRQGAKSIGLCGPTYDDVANTMVPMILAWFLSEEFLDPKHPYSDYKIKFRNGAIIYCYSSEVEKKGPNLEYLWCDEIATWCQGVPEKIKIRFEDITRAVRVGRHPQTIITSTPKTHPFFVDFQKRINDGDKRFCMVQGSMLENPTLPKAYVDSQVELYGKDTRGRQEIYGDLIEDMPGAFWTHKSIDDCRANIPSKLVLGPERNKPPTNDQLMGKVAIVKVDTSIPYLIRILIGFDPAGSSIGDECGIVVVALYSNKEAYVIEDCSGSYDPRTYAKLISDKYIQYNASGVVVETNFGGKETFLYVLRTVNAAMNIIPRHVKLGKTTRAEHVSSLYSQGKVHHVAVFKTLEDQMCSFNVDYSKSPDRLDALGLAITELFFPTDASGNTVSILNLPSRH